MSLLEERDEHRQRERRVMKREFGKTARAAILVSWVTVIIHFFFFYCTESWLWHSGLATLGHVGSLFPCIGRQILDHWTTREVHD